MGIFSPDMAGDLPFAREMEKKLPHWFTEEMRGFSETSELTYDEMLVGQTFLDIHKVAACSTIAEGSVENVRRSPAVIAAYLGAAADA